MQPLYRVSLLWSNINLTTRPITSFVSCDEAGKRGRKREKHTYIWYIFSNISFLSLSLSKQRAWSRSVKQAKDTRERESNERMGIIIPREWISTQAATTYGVFDGINNYPAERLIYGLREVPFYKACPSLGAQLCVLSGRAIGWNLSANFSKKRKGNFGFPSGFEIIQYRRFWDLEIVVVGGGCLSRIKVYVYYC